MKMDNPFDKALNARDIPPHFRAAAVEVTDTLDLAWLAAQSVFEDGARPEHAIAIAELMLRTAPEHLPKP